MGKKFVGLDGLKHFWTKAKAWIAGQITAEVTAKIAEIVANAPEDLDTLKEIADWIKTHANDASAMNTQINTNKNNIAALQTSVAEKAAASHTHDDRYFTEIEVTNKLAGKSDTGHTHTKSEITDFPTSLPVDGGNADTVDNYHVSESATGNTVVARNSSGHIYATYFNQSSSIEDKLNVANIFFDQGDGYLRKMSLNTFKSKLDILHESVVIKHNGAVTIRRSGSIVFVTVKKLTTLTSDGFYDDFIPEGYRPLDYVYMKGFFNSADNEYELEASISPDGSTLIRYRNTINTARGVPISSLSRYSIFFSGTYIC